MHAAVVLTEERRRHDVTIGVNREGTARREARLKNVDRLGGARTIHARLDLVRLARAQVVAQFEYELALTADERARLYRAVGISGHGWHDRCGACREDENEPETDGEYVAHVHQGAYDAAQRWEVAVSPELGRIVLIVGIVLVVVGGLAALGVRLPFGRLPGDIAIEGGSGGFYFPIVTMIIVSVVLTVLFNLFLRR